MFFVSHVLLARYPPFQASMEGRTARLKEAEARAATAERELSARAAEVAATAAAARERDEKAQRLEAVLAAREQQVEGYWCEGRGRVGGRR